MDGVAWISEMANIQAIGWLAKRADTERKFCIGPSRKETRHGCLMNIIAMVTTLVTHLEEGFEDVTLAALKNMQVIEPCIATHFLGKWWHFAPLTPLIEQMAKENHILSGESRENMLKKLEESIAKYGLMIILESRVENVNCDIFHPWLFELVMRKQPWFFFRRVEKWTEKWLRNSVTHRYSRWKF